MIMVVGLVVLFGSFTVWFVCINQADPRLIEMMLPIVGALLVSTVWAIKLIYNNFPVSGFPKVLRDDKINWSLHFAGFKISFGESRFRSFQRCKEAIFIYH